mgnify:FL=1
MTGRPARNPMPPRRSLGRLDLIRQRDEARAQVELARDYLERIRLEAGELDGQPWRLAVEALARLAP